MRYLDMHINHMISHGKKSKQLCLLLRWLAPISLVVTCSALALAQTTGEPTGLGVIAPLSGGAASMGISIQRAIDLVAVPGLRPHYQDDQCQAQKGLSAYQRLRAQGIRFFYVACSGSVLAIAPLAKRNGDLVLTAYAGSIEIRKTGPEVIRFIPDGQSVVQAMLDYFNRQPEQRYGLLWEEQDYADSVASSLRTALGPAVVVDEHYRPYDGSYKSQLLKFKRHDLSAIIFVPVSDQAAQIMYREMRDLDLHKPIIGEVNVCDYAIKPEHFQLQGTCWKAGIDSPGFRQFLDRYRAAYGVSPQYPYYDAITFDSVTIVGRLLAEHRQADPVAFVQQSLLAGQTGLISSYQFDADGEVSGRSYLQQVDFSPAVVTAPLSMGQ